ncbi:MAG: class III extradiol dioxygenase subunit B-like domain-containing protein [Candidatus Nealsonbacteria bacterium]|nr:class III extradiol dioxygenase subunit B-like domain-containing protein [Candidatus Nealsonbacteria bacterium]
MISFACLSPHPPLLLPDIGTAMDKIAVAKTIGSLEKLGKKMAALQPETVVISSPHPDWGFNVPLHFLAGDSKANVKTRLCGQDPPKDHFNEGIAYYFEKLENLPEKIALIASGDLSHRLKKDGPYGFHEQGPKFDAKLISSLQNKDVSTIIELEDEFPEAGQCGLRSFCFLLGILEGAKIPWLVDILSYEGPFGVGYLVAELLF